jgi:hypothetical protein
MFHLRHVSGCGHFPGSIDADPPASSPQRGAARRNRVEYE